MSDRNSIKMHKYIDGYSDVGDGDDGDDGGGGGGGASTEKKSQSSRSRRDARKGSADDTTVRTTLSPRHCFPLVVRTTQEVSGRLEKRSLLYSEFEDPEAPVWKYYYAVFAGSVQELGLGNVKFEEVSRVPLELLPEEDDADLRPYARPL